MRRPSVGDSAVPLGDDEIRRIGDYVKPYLREMVLELVPAATGHTQVLERLGRVEEGIKQNGDHLVRLESELLSQRKLMDERFILTEKRFDLIDRHFEVVDKRFEDVNRRFEEVNQHFGEVNQRFEDVNKRFEDCNRRFEDVNRRFDDVSFRFDDVNHRFGDMQESFRRTQWLIGIGFVMVTAVVTVFGLMA